jgi:hypothetical protein
MKTMHVLLFTALVLVTLVTLSWDENKEDREF